MSSLPISNFPVMDDEAAAPEATTSDKAGGVQLQHNQTMARGLKVKKLAVYDCNTTRRWQKA
jgi:hypothetical protein